MRRPPIRILYQDGSRYWYDTQPTVTTLAEDRAEQLKRNPDKVSEELAERLRENLVQRGDLNRIHPLPATSSEVPDDTDARLVVLSSDYPYHKQPNNPATLAAKGILEYRGNSPRLYRNSLAFLAADGQRLKGLDDGLRKFLAWESILEEKDALNLTPHQVRQAQTQLKSADGTVNARLPEAMAVATRAVIAPGCPGVGGVAPDRERATGHSGQQEVAQRGIAADVDCTQPSADGIGQGATLAGKPRRGSPAGAGLRPVSVPAPAEECCRIDQRHCRGHRAPVLLPGQLCLCGQLRRKRGPLPGAARGGGPSISTASNPGH